ncbi:hypothetical protein CISIN_1g038086mg [Citrus sinensis]|uniref:Uncharacterized protein n=1 Tax=Citrus sinensis TaxID=2711 RepID=A0A067EG45_CITSI|nr:hypothetical protein CISIN_1g038086mg [Citrus sinensis]
MPFSYFSLWIVTIWIKPLLAHSSLKSHRRSSLKCGVWKTYKLEFYKTYHYFIFQLSFLYMRLLFSFYMMTWDQLGNRLIEDSLRALT